MPSGRKPKRWPDHAVVKTDISLPGRVRNELADHCESIGSNMNEWCGVVIREALEAARGLPPSPPPAAPKPTRIDILRQYLTGETVLEPCGKPFPCKREEYEPEFHGTLEFCGFCRIKVN